MGYTFELDSHKFSSNDKVTKETGLIGGYQLNLDEIEFEEAKLGDVFYIYVRTLDGNK